MDRVALITGATSAIGTEAARIFSRAGYAVELAARRIGMLDDCAAQIASEGGQALAIEADVTLTADVEKMISRTVKAYGGIDVAFNNAGSGVPPTSLADLGPTTFDDALKVTFAALFCACPPKSRRCLREVAGRS